MRYLLLRLKRFCGFITGFVFFFGGILKLLDPVGAGLVMEEYFNFLHLGFLGPISKLSGTAFAFAETIIGAGLITGIWRKFFGILAMAFQGFFTILTLLLVIFNPEMDCGCFGEAIHLTHMETFLKNIVLCLLLAVYFFPTKVLGTPKNKKYVAFSVVTMSVMLFTFYSWISIPLVDFTDYKPTATLVSKEGYGHEDLFEAVYIYEKDGVQKEFTLENLPDSTWTFISDKTIENESQNSYISLSFYNSEGVYKDHLAAEGKVIIISVYDDIRKHKIARIAKFAKFAEEKGFHVLVISAEEDDRWEEVGITPYYADYKTLISLNRSNGGATYFSDGHLIKKWAYRSIPNEKKLEEISEGDDTELVIDKISRQHLTFQGYLLFVCAVMLLL